MKNVLRIAGIVALVVLAFLFLGYATMYLWNWIMPYLFHLPTVDFYMAIGMVALSKILLGGIRVNASGAQWGPKKYWKAKWESMSAEEKDQFKKEFAERCKNKWGKKETNP